MIVDAQLHVSVPHSKGFPWMPRVRIEASAEQRRRFGAPDSSIEHVVALMDAAGVKYGVLASRGAVYGVDDRYAFDAAERHPGRFGVVIAVQADDPEAADRIATVRRRPYGLGVRFVLPTPTRPDASIDEPIYRELLEVASRHSVPVFLHLTHATGMTTAVARIASDHPGLVIVMDHFGTASVDDSDVAVVLALARYPNVALKWSGIADLSAESFPHRDVWGPIRRIVAAYGAERVMWASDITARPGESYAESVALVGRLLDASESDVALVFGGTAQRLLRWPM